jgi:hypothetical protein
MINNTKLLFRQPKSNSLHGKFHMTVYSIKRHYSLTNFDKVGVLKVWQMRMGIETVSSENKKEHK